MLCLDSSGLTCLGLGVFWGIAAGKTHTHTHWPGLAVPSEDTMTRDKFNDDQLSSGECSAVPTCGCLISADTGCWGNLPPRPAARSLPSLTAGRCQPLKSLHMTFPSSGTLLCPQSPAARRGQSSTGSKAGASLLAGCLFPRSTSSSSLMLQTWALPWLTLLLQQEQPDSWAGGSTAPWSRRASAPQPSQASQHPWPHFKPAAAPAGPLALCSLLVGCHLDQECPWHTAGSVMSNPKLPV